jgi:hypothetical protein
LGFSRRISDRGAIVIGHRRSETAGAALKFLNGGRAFSSVLSRNDKN